MNLVAEALSGDHRRAIRFFKRDDGLYQWREDYIYEDDEVEAHWITGYPLSGVYASLEAAKADAEGSTIWLSQV